MDRNLGRSRGFFTLGWAEYGSLGCCHFSLDTFCCLLGAVMSSKEKSSELSTLSNRRFRLGRLSSFLLELVPNQDKLGLCICCPFFGSSVCVWRITTCDSLSKLVRSAAFEIQYVQPDPSTGTGCHHLWLHWNTCLYVVTSS